MGTWENTRIVTGGLDIARYQSFGSDSCARVGRGCSAWAVSLVLTCAPPGVTFGTLPALLRYVKWPQIAFKCAALRHLSSFRQCGELVPAIAAERMVARLLKIVCCAPWLERNSLYIWCSANNRRIKMQSIFTGMKIEVCNFSVPLPISYAKNQNGTRCATGTVAEVLNNGGFAIKFDDYPHTWDYSRSEARCFRQI